MDGSKIIDLGEWAEDDFSGRCSRAGVTRNRSRQDRTGWDYIVEFAPEIVAGLPADLQPVGISARVQVKSKEKGRPFVDLRLSNALRFAKDPMPCFLLLYRATDGGEPVDVYARHFWTDEIEAALRRARQADEEGRADLNRLTLRIAFDERDRHTDDLVAWLEGGVAGRSRYAEEKAALVATVGFEGGGIHGSLSFAAEDLQALIDHQVGLTETAPPVSVSLVQRRFGIDAPTPLFSGTATTMHLRSHPRPARVRVRPASGEDIWLDGELFLPGVEAPLDMMKLRVVADFLEVVVNGRNEGEVTLVRDFDRKWGLASHRALVEVTRAAAAGPLSLLVTCEGFPNIPAEVTLAGVVEDDALTQFSNVIACFEKAAAGVLPPDLAVSSRDVDIAWNAIVDFNGMVTGSDFSGRFELAEAPPRQLSPPVAAFFFDHVEVGDWVFGAVVRRPVGLFEMSGEAGRIELGPARVVEAVVRRARGDAILGELYGLYQQALRPERATALELCGGSWRQLLAFSGGSAASRAAVEAG